MSKQPLETQTRKPPVHGMKWKRLGVDKEPAFDELYLLCNEKEIGQSDSAYALGLLQAVTAQKDGKEYSFNTGYDSGEAKDIVVTCYTHFCEIKPPIE